MNFFNKMLAVVSSGVIDNIQSGNGTPNNTYTQTMAPRTENILSAIGAILIIVFVGVFGYMIYSVTRKAPPKATQEKTVQAQPNKKNQEAQSLYQKICQLDQADLTKTEGFVEALLTADKYHVPEETKKESE